ncbi:hypothetical protein Hamer_G002838 [Homarus americanus]|uniref:Uncharacterized protein n=1 Tax=Homarus americanus TaxID=6706 RepID=A0A8J5JSW0_HOMAM|nr:hypothetical protein Hamer_G002838 [Homarus americanus]
MKNCTQHWNKGESHKTRPQPRTDQSHELQVAGDDRELTPPSTPPEKLNLLVLKTFFTRYRIEGLTKTVCRPNGSLMVTFDEAVGTRREVISAVVGFLGALPKEVLLGWDTVPVKPYTPRPTGCYRC